MVTYKERDDPDKALRYSLFKKPGYNDIFLSVGILEHPLEYRLTVAHA